MDSNGAQTYGGGVLFAGAQYPGPFYGSTFLSGDGVGGMNFIYGPGTADSQPGLQHVHSDGGLEYIVPVVAAHANFEEWSAAGLPDGGAWASWWTTIGTPTIFLQRYLPDGGAAFLFTDGGVGLVAAETGPFFAATSPTLLNDGLGGAVLIWFDETPASLNVLNAQRFDRNGSPLWGGGQPVTLSSATAPPRGKSSYLSSFRVVPTRDGNVAVFWETNAEGIFAEKLSITTGTRMWERSREASRSAPSPLQAGWT